MLDAISLELVYRTVKWFDWWKCLCIFNELLGRLLDDQLRWLEPSDLNLEYMGVSHLDCVTRVLSCNGPIVARRDCGIKPAWYWSSIKGIKIFTCFCKFYLFLFPILRECTLVKCHCGIFIELASSTIGQRAKRVLGHRAKLTRPVGAKFGQRAKSRRRQRT